MKIGRDEMRGRRNRQIEAELQRTLDEGGNVWAIGDVHGYADTLLALLDSLNLSSRDRVVLLGDLVDRGPSSCEVIRIARENPQIFSVLGNHEEMMLNSFDVDNIETMTGVTKVFVSDVQRGTRRNDGPQVLFNNVVVMISWVVRCTLMPS